MSRRLAVRQRRLLIMLLYNVGSTSGPFSFFCQFDSSAYGSSFMFGWFQTKLLDQVLCIFVLGYENPISFLLHLPTQKECQFTYHAYFELLLHLIDKFLHFRFRSRSKHNIINIYLSNNGIKIIVLDKQSFIYSLSLIAFFN